MSDGLFQGTIAGDSLAVDTVREWIQALRSGGYQQGRLRLRRGDAFCCLGVLCDVVDANGWRDDPARGTVQTWSGCRDQVPAQLMYRLHLTDSAGSYGGARSLVRDNDVRECPFREIADTVERELENALARGVEV